ncbi:hypothetical protein VCRA219O19_70155 [Vibrio crassostreae]|nr:hypothetical protein VCRA219O19_70155 [Vibrio crassostreae]
MLNRKQTIEIRILKKAELQESGFVLNELYVLSAFPLFVYHQKGSTFNFAKQ